MPMWNIFESLRRSQSGSEFSPLIDSFHSPFPASIGEYILRPCEANREDLTHDKAQCPVNNASANGHSAEIDSASRAHDYYADGLGADLLLGTSDTIFDLPLEVSDLILSYLSPAALDAARYTCKRWWTILLSNTWLLSSILGVREELLSGKLSHRDLLKKLDRDSDLPSTSQHPDAWRTRFRTRTLIFSVPSPASTRTRPALVATARAGTENGWLVFQLQDRSQDTSNRSRSTLVIYRFDLAELSYYAGAVHDVGGQGALRMGILKEIRHSTEWVLRIDIGDTAGLYSLTTREAFSKSDSPFSLKQLKSSEEVPDSSEGIPGIQSFDRIPDLDSIGSQSWNILAGFPPHEGLHHVCSLEGIRKHAESCFLAEQTKTGNIYVVMEVGPSPKPPPYASYSQPESLLNDFGGDNRYFRGIALLSCPRANTVYKNIAVAPAILKDGGIQVAVVWQTADSEQLVTELYIYDIREAVYYDPCREYSQSVPDSVSTTSEGISEGAISQSCRTVQGKRVTSLEQRMGGIHTFSPLYRLASPQEIALGGLQFPHTTKNQDAHPRNVQYQKCFVWGPTISGQECTQVSMKVFDFSFADRQRLDYRFTYHVRTEWKQDIMYHNVALNSIHCACALHDDGFRIALPNITTVKSSEPGAKKSDTASSSLQKMATLKENLLSLNESAWSLWPRKTATSAPNTDSVHIVGSMSPNDPLARRVALERKQEWLSGRILGMKRAGLTDFEISEIWNISPWTQYGQLRKPEGWRELGQVGAS